MIYWCPFTETHQCNSECVFFKNSDKYISELDCYIPTYKCLLSNAAEKYVDPISFLTNSNNNEYCTNTHR